jgi:hypothetical protein
MSVDKREEEFESDAMLTKRLSINSRVSLSSVSGAARFALTRTMASTIPLACWSIAIKGAHRESDVRLRAVILLFNSTILVLMLARSVLRSA